MPAGTADLTRSERAAVDRALAAAKFMRQAPRCPGASAALLALLRLREATLTELANEIGVHLSGCCYTVRMLSTGRFDGRPSLASVGREPHPIPPALPGLIYRGGKGNRRELRLTAEGLEVARWLAGLP